MIRASVFALLVALSLAACSGGRESKPAPAAETVTGETFTVHTGKIDDIKRVSATLTTRDIGDAVARISGVLVSIKVHEGDKVTKGQVVGTIRDQRLNFEAAAFDAGAVQAEADYRRVKTLFDKGIYAQARMDQAEAMLKSARAQSAAANELATQGTLLAPATGTVVKADVPAGAVVMAGQSVVTVTAGPRVVRLQLPEQQAGALSLGQTVSLEANGTTTTGKIRQIYPAITNGQVMADVTPEGLEGVLVGQHVITSLSLGKREGIRVPASYVSTRYGLDYVRLVGPDRRVSELPIQTAPLETGALEVLSGLKDGDVLAPYGGAK